MFKKYIKTASMSSQNQTQAGLFYLLPQILLRIVQLVPLLLLWRTLMRSDVETGMQLSQLLTYTYASALLSGLLSIRSSLTNWFYDGILVSLYQRPMSVYGHVISQTLGEALPLLLFFSVPMAFLSPLFGVSLSPATLWFIPSLLLCMSLGFAFEFLFASLFIRVVNATWLAYTIRNALMWLFSGVLIPFAVLPWGLADVFPYLPLGSLGGAPLSLYAGLADPMKTLGVQLFWNAVLWPLAIAAFGKSQERMVSHGG